MSTTITPTSNDDWEILCAIYGNDDDSDTSNNFYRHHICGGFCGTVYMTLLSTTRIVFARLVRNDGTFRYFTLSKPPIFKLDLLYYCSIYNEEEQEEQQQEQQQEEDQEQSPSDFRLEWEYYPSEWPAVDQEVMRSWLSQKCREILQDEGSFSVCQFLEHDAISSYYEYTTNSNSNNTNSSNTIGYSSSIVNTSNNWKAYDDPRYPDYLLIILPPLMDQLYYISTGVMIHPQKEAAKKLMQNNKNNNAAAAAANNRKILAKPTTKISATSNIDTILDFGRYALIENWTDLYKTKCPICLEESILYSDGIVLPYCQHYCCRDCFVMYLKYKVQDIKQYRTNPFVCPDDTCQRELPMTFCKPYLCNDDVNTTKAWYKDLKNPPAWSLDRCLRTKACGAIGSIRRRKGVCNIINNNKTNSHSSFSLSMQQHSSSNNNLDSIVYCESCQASWCELCLTRVYDDDDFGVCKPVRTGTGYAVVKLKTTKEQKKNSVRRLISNQRDSSTTTNQKQRHTISNHKYKCQPQPILKFCRRYMAASDEIKQKCETKFPWINSYSQYCQHDGSAISYIKEHGAQCPNCSTGVERIEGCFHMKCPTCATHFCYECSAEIFYPFYGTHHCWEVGEEVEGFHNINDDMDEQLAMALQFMNG